MKRFTLLMTTLIMLLGCIPASAQEHQNKNIVGIALGTPLHPRVKYERILNDKMTIGGIATIYAWNFIDSSDDYYTGFQVAPIGRYHFVRKAGDGMYVQAKIPMGYYQEKVSDSWSDVDDGYSNGASFFSVGFGAAIGYQVLIKNSKWSIDTYIGVQYGTSKTIHEDKSRSLWGEINSPGSILDGHLSICYRF